MKRFFCFLICLCTVLAAALPPWTAAKAAPALPGEYDLFVSPAGDDAAPGTKEAPLRTPAGAKARLAALKTAVPEETEITVWFAGGRYEFGETLVFTQLDRANVCFRALPGETPVFTGAKALTGFETAQVNGVNVFTKQLSAETASFHSLFGKTGQLPTPRWPKQGYFTVKGLCPEDDLFTEDTTPWEFTLGQRSFYGDPKELNVSFSRPESVVVRILHYWHDELAYLTGYDAETGKISLSRPSGMLIRTVDRYYFENVFEALRDPGEWYLDETQNRLYYVPQEGETPESLVLRASGLEKLIEIDGLSGLRFQGISFAETDWTVPVPQGSWAGWRMDYNIDALQAALDVNGVITARHAENVWFENCAFTDLGACGVKLMQGVKHSGVENCYFHNIAATAVYAGGENCLPDQPDYTADVTVRNNEICGYGRRFFCAVGVHITFCDTAVVENNEIHDGYYTGISCGWVWGYAYHATKNISIRRNLIYDIGQGWLSDMGGIYMLGVQPGTVLSENVIHNVAADPGEGGYGGWGIYLDEGSSFMTVEKNLVFCCGSQGLNVHYGEGNVIRNNISALSAEGQASAGSRREPHATAIYYNNIFVTEGKAPIYAYMQEPGHFYENGNLFWNVTPGEKLWFAANDAHEIMPLREAGRRGLLHNETVADPLFADIAHFDFTLSEDSPALALNFIPWDYAAAGTLPGTTVGLDRTGGQTPYAAGARMNPKADFHRSDGLSLPLLLAAVLLAAAALLAVLGSLLKAAPAATARTALMLLFCFAAAVGTYRWFVDWSTVGYALCSIPLYAAAALLAPAKPAKDKKGFIKSYLVRLLAVMAVFYGLTVLTNNVIDFDEPVAIGIVYTALGVYLLACTLWQVRNRSKGPEPGNGH